MKIEKINKRKLIFFNYGAIKLIFFTSDGQPSDIKLTGQCVVLMSGGLTTRYRDF